MHQDAVFGNPNVVLTPYWAFSYIPPVLSFFGLAGLVLGIVRRNAILVTFAGYIGVLTLWAANVWPIGPLFDHVPVLSRMNTYYLAGPVQILLCVAAGYGLHSLAVAGRRQWAMILTGWIIVCMGLLGLAAHLFILAYPVIDYDIIRKSSIPAVAWALLIPMLVFIARPSGGRNRRTYWMIALTAAITSAAANFPFGEFMTTAWVRLSLLAMFLVSSLVCLYLWRSRRAQWVAFVTALCIPLVIQTISFVRTPGWPQRYDVFTDAPYTSYLEKTSPAWRTYALDGFLFPNISAALGIRSVNHLGNLIPPPTAAFLRSYLDSTQSTTQFYGLPLFGGKPLVEINRHRRFWDYIGMRFLISGFAGSNPDEQIIESPHNNAVPLASDSSTPADARPVLLGAPGPAFMEDRVWCADGSFDGVLVRLNTYANPGTVELQVRNQAGRVLDRVLEDSEALGGNMMQLLILHETACRDSTAAIVLRLEHHRSDPSLAIAAWRVPGKSGFLMQRVKISQQPTEDVGVFSPVPFQRKVTIPVLCPADSLVGFDVALSTYARVNRGRVVLNIKDRSGRLVDTRFLDSSTLQDNAFAQFKMPPTLCDAGHREQYFFELSHEPSDPGSMLAIWKTADGSRIRFRLRVSAGHSYRVVLQDQESRATVWENTAAQPGLYIAPQMAVAPSWTEAQRLFAASPDLREKAYVESPAELCAENSRLRAGGHLADISNYAVTPNEFSATVRTNAPGMLVVVNSYMPGWSATLNGRPASVARVNGTFMGACVNTPGVYDVRFKYDPRLLFWELSDGVFGGM
jgi:hypothetical protein